MKLFNRILAILVLPLILIGGVNYYFDPDYTLRTNYVAPLVKALLDGKMISGPVNVNSRLLKKKWIEELSNTPDVLVLGSSHTLALSRQSFPDRSFFNASVSNCTFQDMYAFLELFERKDRGLPRTIIICTDQWLFGNSFVETQWLENRSEFLGMAQKVNVMSLSEFPLKWDLHKEWMKELFSVRYLIRSLKARGKTDEFEICKTVDKSRMMFLPDGSRNIPEWVIKTPESDVLKEAENYFYSGKDEHFSDLDEGQCDLFEKMIKYLRINNCRVILFVPPYHPVTFDLLKQSTGSIGIFKAEKYIRNFAQGDDLKIIGATNPDLLNLSASDFYDAVHLKPESLNRIFKSDALN